MQTQPTRRQFMRSLSGAAAATAIVPRASLPAAANGGAAWPIGCFNRPWSPFSYDEALAGMQAAGFTLTGILGDHADEPFTSDAATGEYLARLRERIEAHGLNVAVAWFRARLDVDLEEANAAARGLIDRAHRLGATYLLTTGADDPAAFDGYYRRMAAAADYAADLGMQVVLKPHGGCSAAADELLQALERVDRDNFRLWYDAGNIVHYTGVDPVADVARVAQYVVGFSAKDCRERGGDVMMQFGEGSVDFASVFAQLQQAGFSGPVFVECCRAGSPEELVNNSRANRVFLQRTIAAL